VPLFFKNVSTCAGVADGLRDLNKAAAPATFGAAILVPDFMPSPFALILSGNVDRTLVPGAAMSTTDPKLEYDATKSSEFDTVTG
jgi:hypothetical protein